MFRRNGNGKGDVTVQIDELPATVLSSRIPSQIIRDLLRQYPVLRNRKMTFSIVVINGAAGVFQMWQGDIMPPQSSVVLVTDHHNSRIEAFHEESQDGQNG